MAFHMLMPLCPLTSCKSSSFFKESFQAVQNFGKLVPVETNTESCDDRMPPEGIDLELPGLKGVAGLAASGRIENA